MLAVVRAITHHEPVVVAREGQRAGHGPVGQRPIAMQVVEVVLAVLQEDPQGLALGLADQGRVGVATADVGEAADLREHLAEMIGPFPGDREGADAA